MRFFMPIESRMLCGLLALVASAGCDTPPSEPSCPLSTVADVSGMVMFSLPPVQPLSGDLVVTGSAQHNRGFAIRQVLVNGVEATNSGFNFSSWTVTVPIATLAADADMTGAVTLRAQAVDSCGATKQFFQSPPFAVTLTPGIRIQQIQLKVTPPDSQDFIPANGTIPATVLLTANPEAAGATVNLSTSIGSLEGVVANAVTLAGDGKMQPATASLLFTSGKAGNALITAAAQSQTAVATVLVADPPLLVPASASMAAGQEITVSALSEGNVTRCDATSSLDFVTTTTNVSPAHVDIVIQAAKMANSGGAVKITCVDAFGQASLPGVYSIP